ncbi:hypothetical protein DQ04_08831020 [Trypanosoma grayi]|uniref:hypothetical protein n=1 Tax=Trypanosoma grayi TaxID=71804 RepID=UPI0004F4A71B|nr:hypothetical protein DQ04_08831020 [Trypanosoma grayi]KEG07787.1 hypothetical protein DQ04_08831020 [Trypanosoma grayi]
MGHRFRAVHVKEAREAHDEGAAQNVGANAGGPPLHRTGHDERHVRALIVSLRLQQLKETGDSLVHQRRQRGHPQQFSDSHRESALHRTSHGAGLIDATYNACGLVHAHRKKVIQAACTLWCGQQAPKCHAHRVLELWGEVVAPHDVNEHLANGGKMRRFERDVALQQHADGLHRRLPHQRLDARHRLAQIFQPGCGEDGLLLQHMVAASLLFLLRLLLLLQEETRKQFQCGHPCCDSHCLDGVREVVPRRALYACWSPTENDAQQRQYGCEYTTGAAAVLRQQLHCVPELQCEMRGIGARLRACQHNIDCAHPRMHSHARELVALHALHGEPQDAGDDAVRHRRPPLVTIHGKDMGLDELHRLHIIRLVLRTQRR